MRTTVRADRPYSLSDLNERRARESMLSLPHMLPLVSHVQDLQRELQVGVPHFDPLDGGVEAPVLILLETPGPKAVGTNFVSRNNPDPTARNIFNTCASLGLRRKDTIIWNVAPWFISSESRSENARSEDVRRGLSYLLRLLPLLPRLSEIILCGGKAGLLIGDLQRLQKYNLSKTFHFAARAFNLPRQREHIFSTLNASARRIAESHRPTIS